MIYIVFVLLLSSKGKEIDCESKIRYFNSLSNNCEKIKYIEEQKDISCFYPFVNQILDSAKVKASYTAGTSGIYYPSDSLFKVDIQIMKNHCDCK